MRLSSLHNLYAKLKNNGWLIIGLLFLFLFGFSVIGFGECINQTCTWLSDTPQSWFDAVFFTLQMLVMNYGGIHGGDAPWSIQLARFGLPLLTSISMIKGLIEVIAYRHLPFRIRFWREHIVFCGCGDQARALIEEYLSHDPKKKIVVIDVSDIAENKKLEKKGVLFLKEDAKSPDALHKVRVMNARCVYLMAGSDQTNLEIFEAFKKEIVSNSHQSARKSSKDCFIHVYDDTLKSLIDKGLEEQRPIYQCYGWEIRSINTWATSARALLSGEHGPHLHCPDDLQPHILILGNGWLAEQLIIQGAQLGHYPGNRKLRITYIDEDAEQLRDRIYAQYPVLDPKQTAHLAWHANETGWLPVIDTCFVAKPADGLTGELFAQVIESSPLAAVYICHPDDEQALRILAGLKANLTSPVVNWKLRLVLCDTHGHNLNYIAGNADHKDNGALYTRVQVHYFDAITAGVHLKKDEDVIEGLRETWAKAIHAYFREKNPRNAKDWEDLPEDLRDSNRQSADHWKIKLDWLRGKYSGDWDAVLKDHLEILMRLEHERWCAERFMKGWRYCDRPVSKEDQDAAKKIKLSWCLCPFDLLLKEDQNKDKDVCDVAAKLYSLYGEQIH